MLKIVIALLFLMSTVTSHAAVDRPGKRYRVVKLSCWGATVDVGPSISGFDCKDDHHHKYWGYIGGWGIGGLVTVSYFWIHARIEKGLPVSGQYTGTSWAVALGGGAGAGYFARNAEGGWWPDFSAPEYMYVYGLHLGGAGDLSANTLYISRY